MTPQTEADLLKDMAKANEQLHTLMGNGQPGIIKEHADRLAGLERRFWWLITAIITVSFLTGSGTLTLQNLMPLFKAL